MSSFHHMYCTYRLTASRSDSCKTKQIFRASLRGVMPLSSPVTATAVERSTGQIGRAAVAAMQVSGQRG